MNRIRNERIRGTTKVREISKKVQESRNGGTEMQREEMRRICHKGGIVMGVPGKRRKGRPKQRWTDSIKYDLTEKG